MKHKHNFNFLVVHDFDEPLFTKRTCLRRAFWLIVYAFFGWSEWVRNRMPKWLMYEKYSQARALALLDEMLGVDAVFAFRRQIDRAFPTLRGEIKKMGIKVVDHWHLKEPRRGHNEWKARGAWEGELADPTKHYMNYDRHYVMNEKVTPDKGTIVSWHVDHMSYNLYYYLEFLESLMKGDANRL